MQINREFVPIIAAAALAVETGLVTFLLRQSGCASLPVFVGYFLINVAVFFLMIGALYMRLHVPILVLELVVVILDAVCIKLLTSFGRFRGDGFRGVSWWRAGLVSIAASFFVGYVAAGILIF